MYFKQITRCIHTTRLILAAEKSTLATLRKKTGYTFANCKKALEMHNNDLSKAEQWLKEQAQTMGWTKATKLEGRNTSQGLVGLLVKNNIGAMVEVNCETDFVARNESFSSFVRAASAACVKHASSYEQDQNVQKIGLNTEALRQIKLDDGKTLGDHLALLIGTVGENASLKRAICFKAPENIVLAGYTHPAPATEPESNEPVVGKYASVVAFKKNDENSREILRKISQHIVGMKPVKIGDKNVDKPCENKDDETCLIYQEYVLDSDYTVGEIMEENNVEIVDYQRFGCGEKVES